MDLLRAEPLPRSVSHQSPIPSQMAAAQLAVLAGFVDLFAAVIAQRIEQPKPQAASRFRADQYRLVYQRGQQVDEILAKHVAVANLFCRFEFKASREYR
jgi:hypothetical protein